MVKSGVIGAGLYKRTKQRFCEASVFKYKGLGYKILFIAMNRGTDLINRKMKLLHRSLLS